MPTTALTINTAWTKAADGPCSVLIPAIQRFSFAITAGPAPGLGPSVCPSREKDSELSCELLDGESLYVAAGNAFQTTVTKDA